MKKMKLLLLSSLVMAAVMFTSCGGDEPRKSGVTVDGEILDLPWVGIDMGDYNDGNYEIAFLAAEPEGSVWDQDPYLIFQISSDWDGLEVDLTEVDDDFDWSWWIGYQNGNEYFEGFGATVEQFVDVTGGFIKITELNADDLTFEIEANVEFGDKTIKAYYKGQLEPFNVPVSARSEKGNN